MANKANVYEKIPASDQDVVFTAFDGMHWLLAAGWEHAWFRDAVPERIERLRYLPKRDYFFWLGGAQ